MRLCPLERADYERLDPRDPIFTVNTKYKSKSYYINRYFEHPMYAYSFFAITDCDGRIAAILIARVCGDGEANCLRIVDLIGDAAYLACVRTQIQELLQAENYEYIDFLEFGLEDQLLKNGGFINRGEYADVIVPNYFEPFCGKTLISTARSRQWYGMPSLSFSKRMRIRTGQMFCKAFINSDSFRFSAGNRCSPAGAEEAARPCRSGRRVPRWSSPDRRPVNGYSPRLQRYSCRRDSS